MSWITLDEDFYRSTPPGSFGEIKLGINYNYETGDYELKGLSMPTFSPSVYFSNGVWYSDAIKDPKLFVDGDPNRPTQLVKDLSIDINKKVYAAFQTRGGTAKGNVVNAAAKPENRDKFRVYNAPVGSGPPPSFPGIGSAYSAPPRQGNFFDPGLGIQDKYKDFKSVNEDKLFKGVLKYPKDILEKKQDTLHIEMFRYRPPLEDLLNPKPGSEPVDIAKIFTEGVQRNSGLKDPIGSVILPIPAGISDSNNVEWGDDRMNNMTMAVTSQVTKDLGGSTLAAALTAFLNMIAQAKTQGQGLPTGAINQVFLLQQAGADLQKMPDIKAAFMSMILKNAQFDVSPETILARGAGIVPNSNLELLFRGPTLRQFQFAYRFSPRSEEEAKDVRRIIRFFKQGSAARKLNASGGAGQGSVFLGSPNVFKLEYRTTGDKSIAGVNKFKICALQGVSVNYAPDGQWSAYEEGQPVSYTMTLGFQEIEPIYESDYQDKIFDGLSNDYAKITDDDIGY